MPARPTRYPASSARPNGDMPIRNAEGSPTPRALRADQDSINRAASLARMPIFTPLAVAAAFAAEITPSW